MLCNVVSAQLIAVTGKYTGTGINNTSITGLGFKPDLVLINSGQYHAQITTSTLPANNTKSMNGGSAIPGLIKSLDLNGFTVDNDNEVNRAGTAYDYFALKKETGVLEMGSYTGNNSDNRNISGISFKPDMVIIIAEDNNQKPIYSSGTMGADESMNFLSSGFVSNRIQAFNSNGFQVGKNKAVNESGVTYHFIALKSTDGKIDVGSYTGDGTNNRVIPTAGTGSFVMIKRDGDNAVHRNIDMPDNNAYYFKNSASVSDRIKRNIAAGFELGNHNDVNKSGEEYHYLKIIGINSILPVKLISFDTKLIQEKVELEWKTAPAQNIISFKIERSKDQLNYGSIAEIAGNPVNPDPGSYSYRDADPLPGYSYYRLKMIEQNGGYEYSEIKRVYIPAYDKNKFTVYPNPLHGNKITIDQTNPGSKVYIDIIDFNGQKVDSCVLTGSTLQINLKNNLPPGIYYLIGNNGKAILFRKKIVKL